MPTGLALERSTSVNIALEVDGASYHSIPLKIQIRDAEVLRVVMPLLIEQPQKLLNEPLPTSHVSTPLSVPETVQDDSPTTQYVYTKALT